MFYGHSALRHLKEVGERSAPTLNATDQSAHHTTPFLGFWHLCKYHLCLHFLKSKAYTQMELVREIPAQEVGA